MENKNSGTKPVVLIICNYFAPGYKSGGLRTLVQMVERFRDKFDFRVIALDRDSDNVPYKTVKINEWNETDGAHVFYLGENTRKISKLRELVLEVAPDAVYINSVFADLSIYLLLLRKFGAIPRQTNIILAPEGELSDAALQLKATKKKVFIKFAKSLNLYRDLIWKAAAEPEKQETERFKGTGGKIFIAPNIPSSRLLENYIHGDKPEKTKGAARMVFLSRYMRKKNFKWLLDHLDNIKGDLEIDIYGPIEDAAYWEESKRAIAALPANIKIEYRGSLRHDEAIKKLCAYHFFVLPTAGENFGHVFIEALAAGCPLITSDRTPWTDLEAKRIGWDMPLEAPEKWNEVINQCLAMDAENYTKLSENARQYACDWLLDPKVEEDTLKVLEYSINKSLN